MYYAYFDPLNKNEICGVGKTKSDNSILVDVALWERLWLNPSLFSKFYFDGVSVEEKPTFLKQCTNTFYPIAKNIEWGEFRTKNGLIVERFFSSLTISVLDNPYNEAEQATQFPIFVENSKSGFLICSKIVFIKDLLVSPLTLDVGILPVSIYSHDIFK